MVTTKDHYLVDIYGCATSLELVEYWDSVIPDLCEKIGLTIVKRVSHQFSPYGATIVFILAESHLAVHTWPEEHFVALELFSCKPLDNFSLIINNFLDELEFQKSVLRVIHRGSNENIDPEKLVVYHSK